MKANALVCPPSTEELGSFSPSANFQPHKDKLWGPFAELTWFQLKGFLHLCIAKPTFCVFSPRLQPKVVFKSIRVIFLVVVGICSGLFPESCICVKVSTSLPGNHLGVADMTQGRTGICSIGWFNLKQLLKDIIGGEKKHAVSWVRSKPHLSSTQTTPTTADRTSSAASLLTWNTFAPFFRF